MEDRSKRRARLILIVGFMLALLAAAGTFAFASGTKSVDTPALPPTTEVLVASREIPQRTVVSATDLKVVKMNSDVVPPSALRVEQQKDVVGKVNTVPIATGEVLTTAKFGDKDKVFSVFPADVAITPGQAIPPGTPNYRAMSITVQDANAVGGAIQVGDIVDILYTMTIDPNKYFTQQQGVTPGSPQDTRLVDQSAKILLQKVPIIARTLQVYTIRTDAETSERLAYLQAAGAQIQFLLRASQDDRGIKTDGATFAQVYRVLQPLIPQRITP